MSTETYLIRGDISLEDNFNNLLAYCESFEEFDSIPKKPPFPRKINSRLCEYTLTTSVRFGAITAEDSLFVRSLICISEELDYRHNSIITEILYSLGCIHQFKKLGYPLVHIPCDVAQFIRNTRNTHSIMLLGFKRLRELYGNELQLLDDFNIQDVMVIVDDQLNQAAIDLRRLRE